MENISPITLEFLQLAKKTCIYVSYGEYEGLRDPSLSELIMLKALCEAAIEEKKLER